MSRTERGKNYRPYSRESPYGRFVFRRKARAAQRAATRAGRYDEVVEPKGTQGWMTW